MDAPGVTSSQMRKPCPAPERIPRAQFIFYCDGGAHQVKDDTRPMTSDLACGHRYMCVDCHGAARSLGTHCRCHQESYSLQYMTAVRHGVSNKRDKGSRLPAAKRRRTQELAEEESEKEVSDAEDEDYEYAPEDDDTKGSAGQARPAGNPERGAADVSDTVVTPAGAPAGSAEEAGARRSRLQRDARPLRDTVLLRANTGELLDLIL